MIRRLVTSLLLVVAVVLTCAASASASHFRFGHLTWKRVANNPDGSVTVEFKFIQAWRADGLDALGISFGDGESFFPQNSDFVDLPQQLDIAGEGFVIRTYITQHTYTAQSITNLNGVFKAVGSSCCRIGSLVNAGGASEAVQTVVNLNDGNNGSPVGSIPVILQMPVGQTPSIAIPAADPDADPITCRMATDTESLIPQIAQVNGNLLSVSEGCILSWDLTSTTAVDVGKKFAAQVVLEEAARCIAARPEEDNGEVEMLVIPTGNELLCGGAVLDFIIELVEGTPPSCSSDKPTKNTLFAGQSFTANFTGTDSDLGAQLTVNTFGAPTAAVLTPPALSSSGSPFTANFSWTPTSADKGTAHSVFVTFEDEKRLQSVCSLSLEVSQLDLDCNGVPGGAATLDRCGVCAGDGTSCLGCGPVENNFERQLALDGSALAHQQLVQHLIKKLKGRNKVKGAELEARAKNAYLDAWTVTWGLPTVSQQCSNVEFCSNVSSSDLVDGYREKATELHAITLEVLKYLKGAALKRRVAERSAALLSQNLAQADAFPATVSNCSDSSLKIAGRLF